MDMTKPQLALFSKFRHKCFGLSYEKHAHLQDVVFSCLAYVTYVAEVLEKPIYISNLIDHALTRARAEGLGLTQEEVIAISFTCGSLYDRANELSLKVAIEGTIDQIVTLIGGESLIRFDQFYAKAMELIEHDNSNPDLMKTRERAKSASEAELIEVLY